MQAISENLAHVLSAISDAARQAGRLPESVRLIAVSKTHPVEVIQEAVDAGQLIFGENRVQEAQPKITALPAKLHWHLIGHLQNNTLRELRDKLATEFRFPLPELSMGMSNDFRVAIEEGATMVRVGTAIFGERRR